MTGLPYPYLALREVRKDKRQLKIILEYVEFFHKYRLVITNTGHRPITIEQIGLALGTKKYKGMEPVPRDSVWADEEEVKPPQLPLVLEDGKVAILYLSQVLADKLRDPEQYLDINVFDAEGNIYSKYTEGVYNPKYNYRTGKMKPPSIFRRWSNSIHFALMERRRRKRDKDKGK